MSDRESDWRPIEDAPRDGTWCLIRCAGDRIAVARFSLARWPLKEGWETFTPCAGGIGVGSDHAIHWPEDEPTHWQPLPAPPTGEEGKPAPQ